MTHVPAVWVWVRSICFGAITVLLAACGGAHETDISPKTAGPSSVLAPTWLAQGARLSSAELLAAEQQALSLDPTKTGPSDLVSSLKAGQIAPKSAYLSGEVARKAAALRIPAHRFYNASTGAHFYTTSETERAHVASTLSPPFSYDGPAFSVASDFAPGLSPVHRFYNTRTGVHFYTISESERALVATTLPHFVYEGVAYHASQVAGAGFVPLYRFFVPSRGFHFYTASDVEKATLERDLSATYTYEGIGYHVLSSQWRAEKLPHTGMTRCYRVSRLVWGVCDRSGVIELNPQQDGHRAAINPMRYENLSSLFGLYSYTNCVRDSVTGLVWEGKTAAGERAGSNTYTNLGNNAASDASGYVAAVNASALCGFNDWRVPTRQELLNLVNFNGGLGPNLDTTYFPNTPRNTVYWSNEADRFDSTSVWNVAFGDYPGVSNTMLRSRVLHLRLVRGEPPSVLRQRFTYSSIAYGSDAPNNVVNDAWTGLQWRRCEEQRGWTGTACMGEGRYFAHETALAYARDQIGWRLPNVKELASLTDFSVSLREAALDSQAFPGAHGSVVWASTGYSRDADNFAWSVSFYGGGVQEFGRTGSNRVRLVRIHP